MKSFFTSYKLIYILPLFILSFNYTYSQSVSGITGTFGSGFGNAADANGSYSPNGTISGKNSWVHVGSSNTFYIYWDNSLGTDYWVLDNNTNVNDDVLFFIPSSANVPPSTGWQPGLIDNSSLPTLSGFSNVTISGNAGVAGATLSWTDGSAKTTTADGSGNYTISVSSSFTGTVTPSLTGYTFNPTSKSYTSITSNQTNQNYTATAITYTISGSAGVAGATLSWTDGTAKTATADGSGNYSFTVSNNFTGTVTPSLTGYTFTPSSKSYTNVISDQTAQNYTATVITYTISGNAGVAGATLSWTDGSAKTTMADGTGNYSFTVSNSWTGTVTPSKTGFTFNPTNKSYTTVASNQTSQNYTATAITYTISGNAGVAGAIVEWFDPSIKTTTADGSGNYSITVSYSFSGAVTPVLGGYNFSPTSITYTNVLANQTSQNYTATAITYTISGNAGIAGATLSWTDGTAKTATADGSGNYSFTVSYNFTGTVTPSKTGYTFSPVNTAYSNVLADQTSQNYTATAITYTISGNAGVAGATLSWTDGTAKTATADGSGNYSFTVSYNWTGTVTPSLTGYTFSSTNKTYTNLLSDQTSQNYTATAITYTISGNAGIAGAKLDWTDGIAKATIADGSGNYSFTVSYNWSGTVTPSKTGYTFSPTSKTYTNVLADQTSQNYTATAITYTISGNAGIAGATLSWTDGTAKTAIADGSGNYSFTVSYNFTGTVTPSKTGYTFSPVNTAYSNVLADKTNQNYTATAITYTISGNAGIAGATLSWTDGTAKTATADGSGNYSFTVSYNWTGTVTPSKTGYTFSPVNTSYANVLADKTNQNYTALVTITGNATVPGAILSWTDGTAKTATADGFGNYSFTVSYNWSGTVTPSITGFVFSPASRTYTNVTTNQTGQYNAVVTISGNAGASGVTLSWNDGSPKTTTSDGSGNYSLTVSYSYTGRITPSASGHTFTPAHIDYFNLSTPQTNQNYTATAITYTISGNAGIGGATLSWTDVTAKTATADGSGNYSFTVSYNWSGTVTPSLSGYTFNPASKTYTNVLSDQTNQNYTALVTISGNAGIAGATLSWTDGTAKTATADGSGNYSFTVSYNWSGTVTPSLSGFAFTPASKSYTNVTTNQTNQNYTGLVTVSGNAGIAGATLSWTDGTAKTATADGSGNYSFTVSYNWSGTVTPSLSGYTFNPASKTYTNVTTNQTNQNYTGLVTISGNAGTPNATLSWTDGTAKTATADGSGNYSFTVSYNWSGTITPSLSGFTFTPASKSYTNVITNQINQNYTGLVTISGNAGITGATLSWTDGTAKTTTSDGSGNYSFIVSYNWTGTVTPSKTEYVFTPTSKSYTNATSNQTNQNYISASTAPVLSSIEGDALNYVANNTPANVSGSIVITEPYIANLQSAVVQITGNYSNGQDVLYFSNQNGITGSWNAASGTMTLTGSSSVANYQAALRAVTYNNTSVNPSTLTRIVSFVVNDGTANSNMQTRQISVTAANRPPVLASIEGAALSYTEKDPATVITNTITVSDVDNLNTNGAVISISANYQSGEDVLSFTNQRDITGTWDKASGTLTLIGNTAKSTYQDALRSVKYMNTSNNPSVLPRTVSFTVNDGKDNSNTQSRQISVTAVDDPPVINFNFRPITMNENTTITLPFSTLYPFISDPDNPISTLKISFPHFGNHLTVSQPTDTTVTVTPLKNWHGLDTITVKVSDGILTTSAQLAINVAFVNNLPVFTNVPDSLKITGSQPMVLNIFNMVSDVETPENLLKFDFSSGSDSLLYNYDSKTGVLNISTAPAYRGKTKLTIKVTDTDGGVSQVTIPIRVDKTITGIEALSGQIPRVFELYQNYPNPFNPSTKVRYGLPEESSVVIKIYNILGQEVQTLFDGIERAGYSEKIFNADRIASGMYIYSITAQSLISNKKYSEIKKMVLLK